MEENVASSITKSSLQREDPVVANENILKKQILVMKYKLTEFVKKHKTTVATIRKKYQTKISKLLKVGQRYKSMAAVLKQKIEIEQEENARIIAEHQEEISKLKRELQKERGKKLMGGLSSDEANEHNAAVIEEIAALKDATYAKAQIDSLRQELKSEIAKSAKIAASADSKIVTLEEELDREKDKYREMSNMHALEIEKIELAHQKNIKDIQENNRQLTARNQESTTELQTKIQQASQESARIKFLEDELYMVHQNIDVLKQQLSNKETEFKATLAQKELDITKLKKHLAGIENHAQKLKELTRTYDIFKIYDDLKSLKRYVDEEIKNPEATRMKHLMFKVEKQQHTVRMFEKRIQEKLANFDNELGELAEKIENNTFMEEMGEVE
ncbi:MAG: hypothetical protein HQK53_01610 [Oligoflexia bacterium]|nr:hypothetical protein [Oligoflexia bacterium]